MPPRISVLIPAFNLQGYIKIAIQSALQQSFADIEVIVVDDGSTDSTIADVLSLHDSRVRLVSHGGNLGPAASRNSGVSVANGDWIALLDGDDWWDPTRIEVLLRYAEENDLDIAGDDLWVCETSGCTTVPLWKSRLFGDRFQYFDKPLTVQDIAASRAHAINPLIRTEFFRSHDVRWRTGISYSEDFHFLMDSALNGARIQIFPGAFYYYRKNRLGALTSNLAKTFQGDVESARYYERMVTGKDTRLKRILRGRIRQFLVLWFIARVFEIAVPSSLRDKVLSLRRRIQWLK